jgi:beta-glucosidase
MPWLDKVGAVVEAWYPGTAGGEAIARVLTGEVDASGRLPVTFPASAWPTCRVPSWTATRQGRGRAVRRRLHIEGAAVGYKWYDLKKVEPLFAFGHGLSYTTSSPIRT